MQDAIIVIPCYNEEHRLDLPSFESLLDKECFSILFVNDGSKDRTAEVLDNFCAKHQERASLLSLPVNGGKAEAVRAGMLLALEKGAKITGYADADLSTPPSELFRLLATMQDRKVAVAMGARVALLGSEIHRAKARHYFGRLFATVASMVLELPVYDTQCGAKLFTNTPALRAALQTRFNSAWAFDVELIGRLLTGEPGVAPLSREEFLEVPLVRWTDVQGSKLRPTAMVWAGLELFWIGAIVRKRRNETSKPS